MSSRFRVVVTDFVCDSMDREREILGELADVEPLGCRSEEELLGQVEGAHAMMVYHCLKISARTIERLKACRLIVRCGVGVDNVDLEAARVRGIPVANVPDYGTEEVADSAVGMMLALTRGITRLNSILRGGRSEWTYQHTIPLVRLRGRVLGVVGLGRIGTAVALRAKSLGMDVVYYDPYKPSGYDKSLGVRQVDDLETFFGQSFVVSLHCPLTAETRHIVNARTVAALPRGAYLVNTARGELVDTSILPDAVASGQLAGAGIDVLANEPPRPDDPLVSAWRDPRHPAHDRILINPHAAFYCEQGIEDMRTKSSIACRKALLGQRIPNVVNGVG
ncbi:MAG: hypothetical protein BMS9Abin04_235 [Planctomycetia bacterium]|nr:MAG: hypothetical protein BMS9Abin04_235 [Planctomycetia bacterium]